MKILVGLGNPGKEYRRTRHNVGFRVIDAVAARYGGKASLRRVRSRLAKVELAGVPVVLAKPQTYMNNSGRAVSALLEAYGCDGEDLLVVCDDFHLELGMLRIRRQGSSGGQKGLRSIMDTLGSGDFARLRIGIGPPKGDPVEFVLDEFTKAEAPLVGEAVARAAEACAVCVSQGIEAAMSAFNG